MRTLENNELPGRIIGYERTGEGLMDQVLMNKNYLLESDIQKDGLAKEKE